MLRVALQALKYEPGTHVVSSGALATTSGKKTGELPGSFASCISAVLNSSSI
jgi:hypothetical protein